VDLRKVAEESGQVEETLVVDETAGQNTVS
jgi:hypothetical protein